MAKNFIAGIGWYDTEAKGIADPATVTQEDRNTSAANLQTARDTAYGSDAWVKANFPEYEAVDTSVQHTTGGQVGKNGIRAPSVTRTVALPRDVVLQQQPWQSLGFRELWESTPADQRQALADSINFYRNGGKDAQGFAAIDPMSYNDMTYAGKNGLNRNIFNGPRGTLVAGQHPQQYDKPPMNPDGTPGVSPHRGQEYGINSTFTSADGSVKFSPKYYATVLKDFSPDKRYSGTGTFVSGWQYIAKNLGLSSYSPDMYTGNIKAPKEYSNLPVGASIAGHFGYMWDKEVEARRVARDAKKKGSSSPPSSGGGGGSGGGGSGPFPGGSPTGPGQTPSGQPPYNYHQQPNNNAPPRGPVDYGPAPFNPYPGGDPYGGNGYSGYGHEGYTGYKRPIFGGDSQWVNTYNNWLSSGGPDVSQYAPEMGGVIPPPGDGQPITVPDGSGGNYYDYYRRYLGGGGTSRRGTRVR